MNFLQWNFFYEKEENFCVIRNNQLNMPEIWGILRHWNEMMHLVDEIARIQISHSSDVSIASESSEMRMKMCLMFQLKQFWIISSSCYTIFMSKDDHVSKFFALAFFCVFILNYSNILFCHISLMTSSYSTHVRMCVVLYNDESRNKIFPLDLQSVTKFPDTQQYFFSKSSNFAFSKLCEYETARKIFALGIENRRGIECNL